MNNGLPESQEELEELAITRNEKDGIYGLSNGLVVRWKDGKATRVGRWDPPLEQKKTT